MKRRRFLALDGLRVLAALAMLTAQVALHSDAGPLKGVLSRLDVGAAVFCAISGFLLYRPHVEAWFEETQPPLTLPYLRNRAVRILPVLWVAVLLAVVLLHSADWTTYLQHATLTQVYFEGSAAEGLTQLWSLAAIAAFYVILPALAKLLTGYDRPTRRSVRWRLSVLAALTVVGPVWLTIMSATHHPNAALWLPGYIGWFAVGMGLALWQVARSTGRLGSSALDILTTIPGTVWGIAAALLLLASTPLAGPYDLSAASPGQSAVKSLLYTGIAACVLFPALAPTERALHYLGGRPARLASNLTYGVFAYQLIALTLLTRISTQFVFLFVTTLLASIGLAAASYYTIERPLAGVRSDASGAGRRSPSPSPPALQASQPGDRPDTPGPA
ncbi:acyltransferase family protein [Kribbella sp. NPDC051587]|uniref:acyltransferase family protein n=1 Tax=Kribbella sp. NPDC051587 TaxID=3364119 RepID=UPI003792A381